MAKNIFNSQERGQPLPLTVLISSSKPHPSHTKTSPSTPYFSTALPQLVVGPNDVTTTPGALVHFACEGSGDPEPTVEWRIG